MKRHAETVFLHALGWFAIVAGVIAGFVPFVPGFVFIIIGIYLISLRTPWVKRKLDFIRRHYPGFDHAIKTFEDRIRKIWLKIVSVPTKLIQGLVNFIKNLLKNF